MFCFNALVGFHGRWVKAYTYFKKWIFKAALCLPNKHQCFLNGDVVCFQVLGRGEPWNGGDYMSAPGGGQKVRLLKAALQELESEDQIVLFVDR